MMFAMQLLLDVRIDLKIVLNPLFLHFFWL